MATDTIYKFNRPDQDWNRMIENYRKRLLNIRIHHDIDTARGKYILSQLDAMYGEIRFKYGDILKQYDEVETLIERIRKKAEKTGGNTEARRANGVVAVENVKIEDPDSEEGYKLINLYDIRNFLNHQKEDLEGLLKVIEKKQSLVITMSGLLKIESNIAGH